MTKTASTTMNKEEVKQAIVKVIKVSKTKYRWKSPNKLNKHMIDGLEVKA